MKISEAQRELESCLFTLKQHYKVSWTDKGFEALYFLVRKAKKAKRLSKPNPPDGGR